MRVSAAARKTHNNNVTSAAAVFVKYFFCVFVWLFYDQYIWKCPPLREKHIPNNNVASAAAAAAVFVKYFLCVCIFVVVIPFFYFCYLHFFYLHRTES